MFLKVFHCFFPFYAQERIALVALLSAIRSWKRANRYFALSLTNTSDSVAKTKERIPKPGLMYIFSRAPPVSTPQLTLQTELSDSIVTLFINLLRLDEKISEFVVIDAFALLLTPYTGNWQVLRHADTVLDSQIVACHITAKYSFKIPFWLRGTKLLNILACHRSLTLLSRCRLSHSVKKLAQAQLWAPVGKLFFHYALFFWRINILTLNL